MREASTYRAAKRNQMRGNRPKPMTPVQKATEAAAEAARARLAKWAANGGRETAVSPTVTPEALERMNKPMSAPPNVTTEAADTALERLLTRHQQAGHEEPMPLATMFAARARKLGWVEGVEFYEVPE